MILNNKLNIVIWTFSIFSLLIACQKNPKCELVIDPDAVPVIYSSMIFGGFLEHFNRQVYGGIYDPGSPLADENGFRLDVIDALMSLNVPVIRWPGGCYVNGYNWRDGVGSSRTPKDDVRWGVLDPHTFGTDEFISFTKILGSQPYICNNGESTIQQMKEWVEYCNLKEGENAEIRQNNGSLSPHNVKFWSVGNENYSLSYAQKVLDAAKTLKDVDPNIEVMCPALPKKENMLNLLKIAGDYLDYVSIHCYWIENYQEFSNPGYLSCMMKSEGPENMIKKTIDLLGQAGYRDRIKISFDEWNLRSWHHPGFPREEKVDYDDPEIKGLIKARDKNLDHSLYTITDALFAASFFNSCLRHADDVFMANIAPLVNQTGPIFVGAEGIVKRSHYHTMELYANHLEDRIGKMYVEADQLKQDSTSVAVVDAVATVDESGKKWAISIVNKHPSKEVNCSLKIKGLSIDGVYDVILLTGESIESFNDIENPDRIAPRKTTLSFNEGVTRLPPHSLVILELEIEGYK